MDSTAVTPELVIRAVLELGFLLVVLGYLLFFTNLRQRLFPLGAGVLAVVYVFLFAWGAVQMVDRWQYDYPQKVSFIPLTRFAMYQAQIPESVADSYAWDARLVDGTDRPVNIADEFEAIGLPPMSTKMRVLLGWVRDDDDPEKQAQAEEELALYAQGVANVLASRGEEAESITFSRVTGTPADPQTQVLIGWPVIDGEVQR